MNKTLLLAFLILTACNRTPETAKKEPEPMPASPAVTITKSSWGQLPDGQPLDLYTMKNRNGMEIKVTNYGGIITSWTAPDRNGAYEDVVLGYDSIGGYLRESPYFGALIGRYGNRIAKGRFSLDGKTYTLAVNNIGNHLHGGLKGFDKVVWNASIVDPDGPNPALRLTYRSPDGEEGYPGNLDVEVIYQLNNDDALQIRYQATTDKPTVVNLTQHSYFNLTGGVKRDILDHQVQLHADRFLPVDETLIPTGELRPVKGTVFDFTAPTAIGARINDPNDQQIKFGGGYDHCWVLSSPGATALHPAAAVLEPASGRYMEVSTSEPAIQFYTGNFLDGKITGKNGVVYRHRYGFCLETEHYPDSPNQPSFPGTVLRPGETYRSETVYKFSAKK